MDGICPKSNNLLVSGQYVFYGDYEENITNLKDIKSSI
jgi:hypothetical protein